MAQRAEKITVRELLHDLELYYEREGKKSLAQLRSRVKRILGSARFEQWP